METDRIYRGDRPDRLLRQTEQTLEAGGTNFVKRQDRFWRPSVWADFGDKHNILWRQVGQMRQTGIETKTNFWCTAFEEYWGESILPFQYYLEESLPSAWLGFCFSGERGGFRNA